MEEHNHVYMVETGDFGDTLAAFMAAAGTFAPIPRMFCEALGAGYIHAPLNDNAEGVEVFDPSEAEEWIRSAMEGLEALAYLTGEATPDFGVTLPDIWDDDDVLYLRWGTAHSTTSAWWDGEKGEVQITWFQEAPDAQDEGETARMRVRAATRALAKRARRRAEDDLDSALFDLEACRDRSFSMPLPRPTRREEGQEVADE